MLRKLQKEGEQEGTRHPHQEPNGTDCGSKEKKALTEDDDVSGEPKKKKKRKSRIRRVLKKNVLVKGTCPLEPVPDTSDEEEEVVPVVQPECFGRARRIYGVQEFQIPEVGACKTWDE
ncbi:MAG: hypothetical protein MZW92_54510 [Comamonadaceae bacterium]|nr:hypothetical protein [Comamonadaceae bacterium]